MQIASVSCIRGDMEDPIWLSGFRHCLGRRGLVQPLERQHSAALCTVHHHHACADGHGVPCSNAEKRG